MAALELAGELRELLKRGLVAALGPRGAQPALDLRTVALGQVVQHVAFLVTDTPMHRGVNAQHVPDGLAQRLAAVQHAQHALLDVQTAADEVGQQRGRDGRVLAATLPQPERTSRPPS